MEDEKINQPMTELAGEAAKAERAGGLLESRDYYKPFQYPWAYEAFMQSEQMHWLWTEVPMLEDARTISKSSRIQSATSSRKFCGSSRRATLTCQGPM